MTGAMGRRVAAMSLVPALVALGACGGQGSSSATTSSSSSGSGGGSPAATASASPTPAAGASTGAPGSAPPLRLARCRGIAGMWCGTLAVPLDRAGRRPGSLSLRVVVSAPRRPAAGDLVLLSGGPGQPGVPLAAVVHRRLGRALGGRRLVMLDQRGTGRDALRCPALQAAMGTSDLTVPPRRTVTACARAIGPRREDFTTADTVADLDALRAALGDERWAIGGVSYGTFVAERYALAHPQRVSALYLDSVVLHTGVDALSVGDLRPVVRVLRLVCRRDGGCAGDPGADLRTVLRRYGGGPAMIDTVTAMSIAVVRVMGFVRALHAAAQGDRTPLRRLEGVVRRAQRAPAAFLSQGLHAATLCAESRFPWSAITPPARRAAIARAAARRRAGPLFDAATAAGNGFTALCEHWPRTPAPPRVAARLPDVPTLLINGDEDLSTPLEWARQEAAVAPGGRLVVIHGAGHSTLLHHASARRSLQRFLSRAG